MVDLNRQRFEGEGAPVALTTREAELLAYLAARAGMDVSRDELLQKVWGYAPGVITRTVDVTVRRLRQKLEQDAAQPDHVLTVHGVGYRFVPHDEPGVAAAAPIPIDFEAPPVLGREVELSELEGWVGEGRSLITAVGAGGVGKSALIHAWASRNSSRFGGGVVVVDLTEAEDEASMLALVGSALGARDPVGRAELGRLLAGRDPTLIILDNAERVVASLGDAVRAWRDLSPGTIFLVTSREALRIRREQVLPVRPLVLPSGDAADGPAVELFVARALEVDPDFVPDAPSVAEIVRRLDGLPLAIELAAARTRVMSTADILRHLDHRFDLLKRSRRAGTSHRETLRGTLDWSWSLLTDWEQAALVQCSAFRGGFDMVAAEAVLDLSGWPEAPWAVDVVQTLFDKSLVGSVQGVPQRRCRLYESIRVYVEEKLVTTGAVCYPDGTSYSSPEAQLALWERHGAWAASIEASDHDLELANRAAAAARARARGDVPTAEACGG